MRGWLGTEMALPTSWQRAATTTSSSAPARSARVAVCRQWVSWSVANPSVISSSDRSMPSTRSATRSWFLNVSAPMTAHCSAVDSSMRVKLVSVLAMGRFYGQLPQHVTRRHRAVVGQGVGRQELAQLAGRREVLVLVGDVHLL